MSFVILKRERDRERIVRCSRGGDERERKWRDKDFYSEVEYSKASTARPSDKKGMNTTLK